MRGSAGTAFVILLAAGVPMAALHSWAAENEIRVYLPLIFAVAGVLAIMLAALSRAGWRQSTAAAGTPSEPNPLPWIALAGLLWLASGITSAVEPRPSIALLMLVLWAAVAASAVAVGEAYAIQQVRATEARSRLPPSSVVAGGIVLFLVQPLLTPMIPLAVALIRRAETRQSAP